MFVEAESTRNICLHSNQCDEVHRMSVLFISANITVRQSFLSLVAYSEMRLNRQLCTTFVCRAAIKTSFVVVIGYWLHLLLLGAIWPQPKTQVSSDNFLTVHPTNFDFESAGFSCDLLKNALARYKHLITSQLRRAKTRNAKHDDNWRRVSENAGNLDKLKVDLLSKCEKMPYLGMDESCESLHSSAVDRWINFFFSRSTHCFRIEIWSASGFCLGNPSWPWIFLSTSLCVARLAIGERFRKLVFGFKIIFITFSCSSMKPKYLMSRDSHIEGFWSIRVVILLAWEPSSRSWTEWRTTS